jgi:hypothetical protein
MLEACEWDVKSHKRSKSFWRQLRRTIRHDDKDRQAPEKKEPVESAETAGLPEIAQVEEEAPRREEKPTLHEREKRAWWHLRDSRPLDMQQPETAELEAEHEAEALNLETDVLPIEGPQEEQESLVDNEEKHGLWWHLTHREHSSTSPSSPHAYTEAGEDDLSMEDEEKRSEPSPPSSEDSEA